MKNKKIIVLMIMSILMISIPSLAQENSIIRVSGQGSVTSKPDICTVEFATISKNIDQKKAMDDNNVKTAKLISTLKSNGIKDEDISTSNFDLTPPMLYPNVGQEIRNEYIVTNTTQVTIRNINEIGKYIELGIKNGADSIGYLRYDLSNGEKAYNQALAIALKDAQSKTNTIANILGIKVKGIKLVEEASRNYYSPKTRALDVSAGVEASLNIEVEDLTINANINMESIY